VVSAVCRSSVVGQEKTRQTRKQKGINHQQLVQEFRLEPRRVPVSSEGRKKQWDPSGSEKGGWRITTAGGGFFK